MEKKKEEGKVGKKEERDLKGVKGELIRGGEKGAVKKVEEAEKKEGKGEKVKGVGDDVSW